MTTQSLGAADMIYVRMAVDDVRDRLVAYFGDCLRNVRRVAWRRINYHHAAVVNQEHRLICEIERETLQALIETDSELSDIFLRAYILRRLELIARGFGDIVLIGSSHSLDLRRIKEFLPRNYQPYSYIDLERDAEVQEVTRSVYSFD